MAVLLAAGCRTAPEPEPTEAASLADFGSPPRQAAAHLRIAEHRRRQGDPEGALEAIHHARLRAPRSGSLHLAEAGILIDLYQRNGGAESLARAEAIVQGERRDHPDETAPLVAEAEIHLARGDPEGAEPLLRDALGRMPDDASILALLSISLTGRGRAEEAVERADQALATAPGSAPAREARARALRMLQQSGPARRDARAALRARPMSGRVITLVAELELAAGRPRRALEVLGRIEPSPHGRDERLRGLAASAAGQPDAAREAFARALSGDPGDDVARGAWVELEIADGSPEDALALAQEAPDRVAAAPLRARALVALDREEEALRALREAVEIDPNRPATWLEALAVLEAGSEDPVTRLFGEDGDSGYAYLLRGLLADHDDDARAACEAALERDPTLALAANNLAIARLRAGEAEAAVPLARRAAEALPDEPLVLDTLGLALLRAGRAEEALASFERARRFLEPGTLLALELTAHVAEALEATGQPDRARLSLQGLLGLGPIPGTEVEAPTWLEDARRLHDRLDAAEAAAPEKLDGDASADWESEPDG